MGAEPAPAPAETPAAALAQESAAMAEPAAAVPMPERVNIPLLLEMLMLPEEDDMGDTPILIAARGAYTMPTAARMQLMEPLLRDFLTQGSNPLHENKSGCNAIFYLSGIPDFYKQLLAEDLLPRELALRIPHEEGALLRYARLRNSQAFLAKSIGSREYLTRRYCSPAFTRVERLVRNYLAASSINRIPAGALSDCLAFMHLADASGAEAFVNSLPLWEHGEHFLEEIPAHVLATLHSMGWKVNPGLLRKALHKLGTLLPVSKDDMIECAASVPMSAILEMLTQQEGTGAMPELQQYAEAFDPDIVHTALALQMKLRGIPRPWEPGFSKFNTPELVQIRDTLRVDAAIRRGHMDRLSAADFTTAAALLRQHNMPRHAEMMEGIVEGDTVILRPELRPTFRTRYEELRETSPQVSLLRYLMSHPVLQPQTKEEQP